MENVVMKVMAYGGTEQLQAVKEPLREPREGEVRIRVERAGVALADLMRREGVYPMSPVPPFVPGYDVVGIIDAIGEGVPPSLCDRGMRVGVMFPGTGGYASYVYAPAERVVRIPAAVDPAQAVAILLNYVTAYQMLHRLAKVREGDTILIHGAAGGVGTALLELGRLAGLQMIGTASKAKHDVLARYGAEAIDYRQEDFVEVVRQLHPAGVDAVFDPIGGENWQRSLRTLKPSGCFVGYGYTSALQDADPRSWATDWSTMAGKKQAEDGQSIHLYSVTTLKREHPEWYREDAELLMKLLEQEQIHPIISHSLPLQEAAKAHRLLESSAAVGKIVLIP